MLSYIAAACLVATAHGHSRIVCPPARDMNGFDSTSIKYGPCGDDTDDFSAPAIDISPGPFTIHIQESIQHDGSGWAFYLSEDGNDRSRCLLLDHIPAFPEGKACDVLDGLQCPPGKTVFDEDVWDQLYITLDIPDVACERCSIQMSNIMVDKSGELGNPDGPGCTYDGELGTCQDLPGGYGYHSCSVPLRILGSTPRADYQCPGQPQDWPVEWVGDGGMPVDASVPGLYRRENGAWESTTHFPRDVPSKYTTWAAESFRMQDDEICPFVEGVRNTPPDTTDNDESSLSNGEIVGICVGVGYGIAMIAVGVKVAVGKMTRGARSQEKEQLDSPLLKGADV